MEFLHRRRSATSPQLSFVLLDWSCRESLHILDYLNNQTVPRNLYEIIWIEYYNKRLPELCHRIDSARAGGFHPPVDVYAVLEMPGTVCYHKHLMYNVGILAAQGRILCFCDSDALMHPTLVESILREFQSDPNIVLHLDEVRNNDRRFYPFNNPSFDDIVGLGVANWINGRPLGLSDTTDPLHTRNYGACMCALRDDLIQIGGADMHGDYLGHICGPYEMTFRLVNAGKREVWHQHEWLYHVWHPGQAGDCNYAGPHDGKHLSTTALEARRTGRIEPLLPHPAIRELQQKPSSGEGADWSDAIVRPEWLEEWNLSGVRTTRRSYRLGKGSIALQERSRPSCASQEPDTREEEVRMDRPLGWSARMRLLPLVFGLLNKQLTIKRRVARLHIPPSGVLGTAYEPLRKVRALCAFLQRMLVWNRHLLRVCWRHLCYIASLGQDEVALYGDGDAARILCALSRFLPVRIRAVCPFPESEENHLRSPDRETWTEEDVADYEGLVIVAAFVNSAEHLGRLQRLGLNRERLIVLE